MRPMTYGSAINIHFLKIIYRQSLINDPLGSDLGQLRYTIVFEWANVNHHKLYSRILVRLMIFSYSTFYLLRVVCLSSPDALYCPAVKPTPAQFTMPPVGTACFPLFSNFFFFFFLAQNIFLCHTHIVLLPHDFTGVSPSLLI